MALFITASSFWLSGKLEGAALFLVCIVKHQTLHAVPL